MDKVRDILNSIGAVVGLDGDLVLWGLAGLLALLIVVVIILLVFGRTGSSRKAEERRDLERARVLSKKGKFKEAGALFAKHKLWDNAAAAYSKGADWKSAVEAARNTGRPDILAPMLEGAGLYAEAAREMGKIRKYEAAARLMVKGKKWADAAGFWEKSGNPREAARSYYQAQKWEQAARAAAQAKDYDLAAKILLAGIEAKKAAGEPYGKIAFLAGDALQKSGRRDQAYNVLIDADLDDEVLRLAEATKTEAIAAKLALAAHKLDLASKLSEKSGSHDQAKSVKAASIREQDPFGAGELYAELGEYDKAGDLFAEVGHHAESALMYEKGEYWAQALTQYKKARDRLGLARTLEMTGQYAEAAAAYSATGNLEKAALMFEHADNFLMAARVCIKLNAFNKVEVLLSKIVEDSTDFQASCLVRGELLAQQGREEEALEPLYRGLEGQKVGKANLDSYYLLGRILEKSEKFVEAFRVLRRVNRYDPHYRDVAKRLQALTPKAHAVAVDDDVPSETRTMAMGGGQNRYVILGELGRGGMGIVYKAHDTQLDRIVAYKVLPDELRTQPGAVESFMREARAAASLTHPNIVIVHDVGQDQESIFLVMEYLEGEDLKSILHSRGALPVATGLNVAIQVASGLQYAHDKKLIHRDIKPSNLMMQADGTVKIMDFGLAKIVREVVNYQTMVGGTPFYMSPEQVKGGSADPRADLYSLGITMFELFTGSVPYPRGDIGYQHVHAPIPMMSSVKEELPEELDTIIAKLMAKAPDDRFQNSGELIATLKRLL